MDTMSDSKVLRIGQFNEPTGRQIIKDWKKIRRLTPRHVPSTTASIPSKYQTFFAPITEKKGFRSQAPRFADQLDVDDCPGPGTYSTAEGFKKTDISFSKRGIGGFASKTKRFPCESRTSPGPGVYNPQPMKNQQDFNRAGVSSNFQIPLVLGKKTVHSSPAPNTYNVTMIDNVRSSVAQSSFKSTTKRSIEQPCSENPAPGQYSVNDYVLHKRVSGLGAVFKSKTNRYMLDNQDETPGPGTYTPHNTPSQRLLSYRPKHYLCLSAPAMPLPPLPPPPGPGHYETQGPAVSEKQLVSGAVFLSTTSRWVGPASAEDMPGPSHYNPATPARKSHLCNLDQRWT
eukprot:Em0023g41a